MVLDARGTQCCRTSLGSLVRGKQAGHHTTPARPPGQTSLSVSSPSRQTRAGGWASYSPAEWRSIEPIARNAGEQSRQHPDRRDLFLCHAWEDRDGAAAEMYELLQSNRATVWFSEKDVSLGKPLIREIDRGLANSRVGIVLVTPALLKSLKSEGIADKELSALLASLDAIKVLNRIHPLKTKVGFFLNGGNSLHSSKRLLALFHVWDISIKQSQIELNVQSLFIELTRKIQSALG